MTPRRKSALTGRRLTVSVERNGAEIEVGDVEPSAAPHVLAELLILFRRLAKTYPELVPDCDTVPGGAPIDVREDDWSEEGQRRKRLGFQ